MEGLRGEEGGFVGEDRGGRHGVVVVVVVYLGVLGVALGFSYNRAHRFGGFNSLDVEA